MKTTKNISKKIISLALVFVFVATMFAGCKKKENAKTSAEGSESKTENSTTESVESVIVTDDNGEPVTDESGSTMTETKTQSDKADGSKAPRVTVNNSQTENTTKKNTSSDSKSKKPSNNTKPVNNTKPASSQSSNQCSHSWSAYKWGNTEATYGNKYRTCSKCGKSESWADCNHSYGSWTVRNMYVRYRTCSKCGWEQEQEGDYRSQCMGTKAEYLELLKYVNQARREAGLNELIYLDEFQEGANIRAQEITQKFSHTRPNGENYSTVYDKYRFTTIHGQMFVSSPENIVANASNAQQAFKAWMNSSGHKAVIMREDGFGFVAAKCDNYWMMCVVCG